jgi:hypothetical protein
VYINLAWTRLDQTVPVEDIEGEIFAAFAQVKMVDWFTPWDGCYFASVQSGQTQRQVEKLHQLLVGDAVGRYSYVITVSPNFQDLCRSDDLTDPAWDAMVDYET